MHQLATEILCMLIPELLLPVLKNKKNGHNSTPTLNNWFK